MHRTHRSETGCAEKRPHAPTAIRQDRGAARGEPETYDETQFLAAAYAEHRAQALNYARSLTSRSPLAEDLVSEAFLRLCLRTRSGFVPENPRAYILTTIRNLNIDTWRRGARVQCHDDPGQVEAGSMREMRADDIDAAIDRVDLQRAMATLPAHYAQVLTLSLIEGLSNAEIAEQTGSNPIAIGSLAYRARRALVEAIEVPASARR